MKIHEITHWQLTERARAKNGLADISPSARAVNMLLSCLEKVNQMGLDGKKTTNLTLVERLDNESTDTIYEIHVDITHRLKQESP